MPRLVVPFVLKPNSEDISFSTERAISEWVNLKTRSTVRFHNWARHHFFSSLKLCFNFDINDAAKNDLLHDANLVLLGSIL